jgi:hypothetical protein
MRISNLPLPVVLVFYAACAGRGGEPEKTAGRDTGIVIGRYCAADDDCGAGYRCFNVHTGSAWVPDGYCLLATSACRSDGECPAGTLCSPLPWAEIPGVCLLSCRDDSQCREGYRCAAVELFPGEEGSPKSSGKVCWTSGPGKEPPL